jgi:hypothetical protein
MWFAPRCNTLSQAHKFVHTMLKISSKLLNFSEKEFVEIQKQTVLEKAEELTEMTMMVSKLAKVCGLIKLGIMSTKI